ncbi:MAG: ATP-binding protein [Anaerovoracaceae bacterium]
MIKRELTSKLLEMATKFPVVSLAGPRQSGKSTLLKDCFPKAEYVSLQDDDLLQAVSLDPRGFLDDFKGMAIIDEVQRLPELFSYLQTKVDKTGDSGQFLISGSQNFLLMEKITQTLAGRVGILTLLPFSKSELMDAKLYSMGVTEFMHKGAYPRIYDKAIAPEDYYPSYTDTYLERDVRNMKNINDLALFKNFIYLCADRAGQQLNLSSLANDANISRVTASSWLSILEASFITFRLRPYSRKVSKRVVKSPKLYFYDTGLICSLLSIESPEDLHNYENRGAIFENLVIVDKMKDYYNIGKRPDFYYFRDSNGNEVDLLVSNGRKFEAIEIKYSKTANLKYFKGIDYLSGIIDLPVESRSVIYNGDRDLKTKKGKFISWG